MLVHGRYIAWISAHEAVGLAVDPGQAGDGLAGAGPMRCVAVGEPVGEGPDAGVGIVSDKGDGRRAVVRKARGGGGKEGPSRAGGGTKWRSRRLRAPRCPMS